MKYFYKHWLRLSFTKLFSLPYDLHSFFHFLSSILKFFESYSWVNCCRSETLIFIAECQDIIFAFVNFSFFEFCCCFYYYLLKPIVVFIRISGAPTTLFAASLLPVEGIAELSLTFPLAKTSRAFTPTLVKQLYRRCDRGFW